MNICKEFSQMIIRFFLNDLSKDEETLLNEHIEKCERCKKEFILHTEIETMLKKRPLAHAPASVIKKVLVRIPEKSELYERFYFDWRIVFPLVVITWLIIGLTVYFKCLPMINAFVHKLLYYEYKALIIMITQIPLIIRSPYFIPGIIIFSFLVSIASLLIFWRVQTNEGFSL